MLLTLILLGVGVDADWRVAFDTPVLSRCVLSLHGLGLGHAAIQITLDTYSHVLPGLQEAAMNAFGVGLGVEPEGEGRTRMTG